MFPPIRSLPGAKKQFPNVKSKVDCKRPAMSSAPAVLVEKSAKELKTIPPRPLDSGPKPKAQIVTLAKPSPQPFRARPVPQSHYGQLIRPVLARKGALPSREAVKDPSNGQSVAAVVAAPVQLVAEEGALPSVAAEASPAEQVVKEVSIVSAAVDATAFQPEQVLESLKTIEADEVLEAPVVVEDVPVQHTAIAPEAVQAAPIPTEQSVEPLDAVEAPQVEEAIHEPPVVVPLAAETPLAQQTSETDKKKKKKRNRKKKSPVSAVTPAPEVPVEAEPQAVEAEPQAVEAEPQAVEESTTTQLTKKQKQNIHTNRRRSAAWKALRQTLGPDAHIYIPPRYEAANNLTAKEVAVDALSKTRLA